jgi:DNA-binding SARP family transcriptional activator
MDANKLTGLTTEEMELIIANMRVVIMSPRSRYRNVFMADFTAKDDSHMYRLLPEDTSLAMFLTNLSLQLADEVTRLGTKTKKALGETNSTPTDVAKALASDLTGTFMRFLILDEFDRLEVSPDTVEFFDQFVGNLPPGLQLVINGRTIAYNPWNHLVRSGAAVVLGEDAALAGPIFTVDGDEKPHLEVYAFGSGEAHVNGIPVTTWDGPLPRNLFYYFVDHPMVTRDEIFETFWPDLSTKDATNVFHVTKRKISERLGFELTSYSGGFYRPSHEVNLHYDVQYFEEAYKRAGESATIADWMHAVHLYRTEFLHDLDMPWINERRDVLRDMYAEALVNIARIYQGEKDLDQAAHYFLRALGQNPLREDLYRNLMGIYRQQGEHRAAIALYKTLEDVLYRALKIKPSGTTTQLFNTIESELD